MQYVRMNTSAEPSRGADLRAKSKGPLSGLKVIEFAGIGPAPFACMLLADLGADVVTIARPTYRSAGPKDVVGRGRTLLIADLKDEIQKRMVLELAGYADVAVEGFRPGVMERLGLGPEKLLTQNKRLVYARMTGWGQTGPLAHSAGHDLNYIAITGALAAIGTEKTGPIPPLNLVGDYGGGSLYLVVGILAAVRESERNGLGQVVDASIVDGVNHLMSNAMGRSARGTFEEESYTNLLDGSHPYYRCFKTADNQFIAIGAIEPQFFAELCQRINLPIELWNAQHDKSRWDLLSKSLEEIFTSKTRAEWIEILERTDACFAPVLSLSEATRHHHNVQREGFIIIDGVVQPAPAPRFSRTPGRVKNSAPIEAAAFESVLSSWRS